MSTKLSCAVLTCVVLAGCVPLMIAEKRKSDPMLKGTLHEYCSSPGAQGRYLDYEQCVSETRAYRERFERRVDEAIREPAFRQRPSTTCSTYCYSPGNCSTTCE